MNKIPRRTIEELIFLHQIERSLKVIIVEGDYDAAIVERFLLDVGSETIAVCTIDRIEIDDSSLRLRGRDVGNRERVIYLSERTSHQLEISGQILCIADRDFGNWLDETPECRDLLFTDYCCMDSYVWNRAVFGRFLVGYCNRPNWKVEKFMDALRGPVQSMFLIRLAVRSLQLRLRWIEKVVCVKMQAGSMTFNEQEFVKRLLNKNSSFDNQDRLFESIERFRRSLPDDPRESMHSEDFSRLVSFLLKQRRVKAVSTDIRTIKRALVAYLTISEMQEEKLFQRILGFAANPV